MNLLGFPLLYANLYYWNRIYANITLHRETKAGPVSFPFTLMEKRVWQYEY